MSPSWTSPPPPAISHDLSWGLGNKRGVWGLAAGREIGPGLLQGGNYSGYELCHFPLRKRRMLPGVTAGGAEGEALSSARPGSPTSPGPQTLRRTTGIAWERRKMSTGSSPLRPSGLLPGKDAAAVVLRPCWRPKAQLCVGHGRDGAVIQAGNRGEMQSGSKAPLPAPRRAPAGVRALRHLEHPKNQSKWRGLRPPALGGAVKDSNGEKDLGRDGSICPATGSTSCSTQQAAELSRVGVRHPAPSPAPRKPHRALLRRAARPAALSPVPHPGPWQMPPSKGAFRAVLAPLAGGGAGGGASCCCWRRSRRHGLRGRWTAGSAASLPTKAPLSPGQNRI